MRTFIGCVVLESLSNPAVVAELKPVAERAVPMPGDPDATTWHVQNIPTQAPDWVQPSLR